MTATRTEKAASDDPGCKLHLGCGQVYFDGWLNVDARRETACDRQLDCATLDDFPNCRYKVVYSHALLEHLAPKFLAAHFRGLYRILHYRGLVAYFGVPNFEEVIRAYQEDLDFTIPAVERYIYSPEGYNSPFDFPHQHKALWTPVRVRNFLEYAGFNKYRVFTYYHEFEERPFPIGFLASKELTPGWRELAKHVDVDGFCKKPSVVYRRG